MKTGFYQASYIAELLNYIRTPRYTYDLFTSFNAVDVHLDENFIISKSKLFNMENTYYTWNYLSNIGQLQVFFFCLNTIEIPSAEFPT